MTWIQLRSYLIKKDEFNSMLENSRDKNFSGRWMLESKQPYTIFFREYYWSPCYNDLKISSHDEIETIKDKLGIAPQSIELTAHEYYWEGEFDM